ncbi:ankyrin [Colletotrichum sublineola]|nr:ankyrin [Colletotrichum sublineola]
MAAINTNVDANDTLLKLLGMDNDAVLLKLVEGMESSQEDPGAEKIHKLIGLTDDDGRTLLHIAATKGLAKTAKKLIDANADLTVQDRWGETPLIDACREGHEHVVKLFLGKTPETDNISGGENESPLFTAAINGHSRVVQCLLAAFKGNINDKEEQYGMTLLHASSQVGDYKSVRLLRDKSARLDIRDVDGWTPLMTATVYKEKDAMTELLRMQDNENPQLETRDLKGQTPILRAAEDGFWRGVRCLAEASVEYYSDLPKAPKPTETDPTSTDFPSEQLYGNHLLLSFQSKVHELTFKAEENTALHCAIKKGRSGMVQFLLDKGFDVNARDHQGRQPLHLASQRGDKDILEILLKYTNRNHINNGDDEDWTPLHFASKGGDCGSHGQSTLHQGANCQTDEETSSSESESESEFNSKSKSGQYDEVVQVLLKAEADTEAKTKKNDKMAMELAFDHGHVDRARLIFDAFATLHDKGTKTLIWAAGKTERHWIAVLLFKRQQKEPSEASIAKKSESWTAIEWAAYASEPKVLWLLVANSSQSGETKRTIKRAKAVVEKQESQEKTPRSKTEKRVKQTSGTKKGTKDSNKQERPERQETERQEIQDILSNPPIGLLCGDSSTYSEPKCQDKDSSYKYHATIVQFYKKEGRFDRINKSRTVRETIYSHGPAEIMEQVVKYLKNLASSPLEELRKSASISPQTPIFMDSEPKFTWVHLPATNMAWMDHLLQRIMYDEKRPPVHFNQVKSFFKGSWIEVPDKTSASRMMRPRFVSRGKNSSGMRKTGTREVGTQAQDSAKESKENPDDGKREDIRVTEMKDAEKGDSAGREETVNQEQRESQDGKVPLAETAIYMPYMSYSFQCIKGKSDESSQPPKKEGKRSLRADEPTNKPPPEDQEEKKVGHKEGSDNTIKSGQYEEPNRREISEETKKLKYKDMLVEARKKYEELLNEYSGKIVHGSSTLDESYYHFGTDQESLHDKDKRNSSQAQNRGQIQKDLSQGEEQQNLGPYWLLVRVNQLWIWTIDDKWLITASSYPMDDTEDELLKGILDLLEKQGEAAGSDSQPGSAAEMSRLIVDYCVDNYERKPQSREGEVPKNCNLAEFPSIRQVFSKSINSIVCQTILGCM